jgi:hypothetical protein
MGDEVQRPILTVQTCLPVIIELKAVCVRLPPPFSPLPLVRHLPSKRVGHLSKQCSAAFRGCANLPTDTRYNLCFS